MSLSIVFFFEISLTDIDIKLEEKFKTVLPF